MKAKVFSKGILIGLADLNIGDYNMGGLFGTFTPNEYYLDKIQEVVQSFNENTDKDYQTWNSYDLRVELIDGYTFEPLGGITIDDYIDMFNEPLQITLIGVACNVIDKYF